MPPWLGGGGVFAWHWGRPSAPPLPPSSRRRSSKPRKGRPGRPRLSLERRCSSAPFPPTRRLWSPPQIRKRRWVPSFLPGGRQRLGWQRLSALWRYHCMAGRVFRGGWGCWRRGLGAYGAGRWKIRRGQYQELGGGACRHADTAVGRWGRLGIEAVGSEPSRVVGQKISTRGL